MKQEQWKDIKGYVGLYKISNYGNVASLDREVNGIYKEGRILSQALNDGYPMVILYKDGKRETLLVHRLVAEHFLEGQGYVIHLDGDRKNNYYENLTYVKDHRFIKLYCPELDMTFESIRECAAYLMKSGISKMTNQKSLQSRISQVKNGEIPHYRNLTFMEVD